jgi:DnaJ-related protein SCJ1
VLSDNGKRQLYDQFGEEGLKKDVQKAGGQQDLFAAFFGGGGQGGPKKGADLIVPLHVSLKDIYLGREMEVAIKKQTLCSRCRGTGADKPSDIEVCKTCKGTGMIMQQRALGPGFVQQFQSPCTACGGRGKKVKTQCSVCHGTKTSVGEKLLDVTIERGVPEGAEILMPYAADEIPGEVSGDIKFRITTTPHRLFTRNGNNLHYAASVSLAEALTGFHMQIQHLDGHLVEVTRTEVLRPGELMTVKGEGMPIHQIPSTFGDLIISFTIRFPSHLSEDQKKAIKSILN